tara:strand:- start:121 stop:297 length:177 start_codon:yes stop_codon:yes gene_type:complete
MLPRESPAAVRVLEARVEVAKAAKVVVVRVVVVMGDLVVARAARVVPPSTCTRTRSPR